MKIFWMTQLAYVCRMLGADFPYDTVRAVCIGEKTQGEAEKAGMRTVAAKNATVEALVACITEKQEAENGYLC